MTPPVFPTSNRLINALNQEDREALLPLLERVPLAQHLQIYQLGEAIEDVYFIESGLSSFLANMSDGASIEVGMIGMEGVVGFTALLGDPNASQRVVMQVSGEALRLSLVSCRNLFDRRPDMRRVILDFVGRFLKLSSQIAACNRLHSVERRMARWLLMSSDRTQTDTLALTQDYLSYMLGVRRQVVTVTAGELQRSGLIRYHRGAIRLVDRDGLRRMACECYASDLACFEKAL